MLEQQHHMQAVRGAEWTQFRAVYRMELQQFVQKKAGCRVVEDRLPQRWIDKNDPKNDRRVNIWYIVVYF